jgi:hypothetical protein
LIEVTTTFADAERGALFVLGVCLGVFQFFLKNNIYEKHIVKRRV